MKSREYDDRLKTILERLSAQDRGYLLSIIFSDPFKNIYPPLLIIYIVILVGFLLWPFDFVFFAKNNVHWLKNPKGIEFTDIGQVVSKASTQNLLHRLANGNGLTIEMWLNTEDLDQSGPARIFSYSKNSYLRNFTIGQSEDQLVFRLRTTETDLNGTNPHLIVNDIFNSKDIQHIVIMYDFLKQTVYVNGELKKRSDKVKGHFSNWDSSCCLLIGNELTGDRPWKGKIYYAAIFNRVLTEPEIHQHYLSGLPVKIDNIKFNYQGRNTNEPLARYVFDEGSGSEIHDSGSTSTPVHLFIPQFIWNKTKPFLSVQTGIFHNRSWDTDVIINILIFIPLGILIHSTLRTHYTMSLKMSMLVLFFGALFTFCIESAQYFSVTRYSSFIDVVTNTIGTAMGIMADRFYFWYLNHQADNFQKLFHDQGE